MTRAANSVKSKYIEKYKDIKGFHNAIVQR